MIRREDIKVKSGVEFDHYFPKAKLITITKKENATVADTLLLIPAIILETRFHTKRFALEYIKQATLEGTLRKLWDFVYTHIAYKKDEDGKEQVRSPARTWHDRHNVNENGEPSGVDCDCYSVFISSVLCNLNIPHYFRITKYPDKNGETNPDKLPYSHIYVIVPKKGGGHYTVDCVVSRFDYEEPYITKHDKQMELEYLNGVEDNSALIKTNSPNDFMGFMEDKNLLSELGNILGKGRGAGGKNAISKLKTAAAKTGKAINKGLHVTNVANPATVLLRSGILAGMKINFLKIAENLRFTYLSPEQATRLGAALPVYNALKQVREKLEKIFYTAGGQPKNLQKAILTGKGNKDKKIIFEGGQVKNLAGLNEDMNLGELLGQELFTEEYEKGIAGYASLAGIGALGELGEPATATAITAASSVLASIAALIKGAGSLFPKKEHKKDKSKNEEAENSSAEKTTSSGETESNNSGKSSASGENNTSETNSENNAENNSAQRTASNAENSGGDTDSAKEENKTEDSANDKKSETKNASEKNDAAKEKKSFWEDNKKWIIPGIGVGTLGLGFLIYALFKPKKKEAVNGIPKQPASPKTNKKKNILSGIKTKSGKPKKAVKATAKKTLIRLS